MTSAYREAAGVLDVVLSRKRGLRAAPWRQALNKRKVLALVTRTLQSQRLRGGRARRAGASKKLVAAVPGRAMRLLMLYDLLLGREDIRGRQAARRKGPQGAPREGPAQRRQS